MESGSPPLRTPPDGAPPALRLNGWKEVATHFGKGVRTVQRWEREFGMPVHRMGGSRSDAVYAFVAELEQWRQTAEAKRAESRGEVGPRETGASIGGSQPADASPGPVQAAAPDRAATREPAPAFKRRWIGAAAALVLLAAVAWLTWWALGPGHQASTPPGGSASIVALRQPADARVENGVLRVYDDAGLFLWDWRFDVRLTDAAYRDGDKPREGAIVVDDIDGDGNAEVLFVFEPASTNSRGLFCFDHDGTERFHHQPNPTVQFGPLPAAPPWRGFFVRAIGKPGRPHNVWFVSTHIEEFPTIVEKLDAHDHVLGQYWSNGQVSLVEERDVGSRRMVFIGGTSNEFRGAALAVLNEQHPTASAPAVNPHYQCVGCPPALPEAYLVFPRLDVTIAADTYSRVTDVRFDDAGQVYVELFHSADPLVPDAKSLPLSTSSYMLGSRFRVIKAELGDKYSVIHDLLQRAGYIRDPFSKEAEARTLWPVRRWEGGRFVQIAGPEISR